MAAMPGIVAAAVLQKSDDSELKDTAACEGPDFDKDRSLDGLCAKLLTTGFQATNIGLAVKEIERMRAWRLSDVPITENEDDDFKSPEVRRNTKAKIFLAYTSNMISSGVREVIRYLVQHKHVDVLVTTGGGIEEDLMKCLAPHKMGDFALRGKDLRPKGLNRIGNLLVPNDTYCKFEDWLRPILHKMHDEVDAKALTAASRGLPAVLRHRRDAPPSHNEVGGLIFDFELVSGGVIDTYHTQAQTDDAFHWTPSSMIDRFGKEIDDPSSVYYWCHKNSIPVFCPAITDGSIGDMLYFHSYKRPGFIVDIARDIRLINDEAVKAKATGMIIIGGGLVKHHTCNANLMRNGANFAVFVNTGQEFDGSDSGARPDEAVSWGKIRMEAKPVKVYADATLAFPLIVSQTFAKK